MKVRFVLAALIAMVAGSTFAAPRNIGINVLLNTHVTDALVAHLSQYGRVGNKLLSIDAVTMSIDPSQLDAIRALPYVAAANPDAERTGAPVDTVSVTDFTGGLSTWDNDAINVTHFGMFGRAVPYDGTGVYVAVIDTGLLDSWRKYFPQERIATQFAKAFSGGGGLNGRVSEPTNKWEHDQNSHGTHVTSTILGYSLNGVPINGVAPGATVIPVKVLNQNGSGWSSVVARGIEYVADLKNSGALGGAPVVINMSLGGPALDAVEKAAVDYAVSSGVIIVAAAGNEGTAGMGYPGAYQPVISVAAAGWVGQWSPAGNNAWWFNRDVPDPTDAGQFYIADFSSRQLAGQDLDVAAPGVWVVGPYQANSGNRTSYFLLSGTSMASPHVAGIAALMMQKDPALTQGAVETLLEGAATPMAAGCANVRQPSTAVTQVCWGADAVGSGFITADAALAATP
ncbi:MAG TPA: S8 family serine peptidase [Rhodanobacteraceae bacterium]|nr:S8 family serine peptidase [Rhodanobacteraceae bacterium]